MVNTPKEPQLQVIKCILPSLLREGQTWLVEEAFYPSLPSGIYRSYFPVLSHGFFVGANWGFL